MTAKRCVVCWGRAGEGVVPDVTTLLKFRRLLEKHELTKAILAEVCAVLTERGLMLRKGTLVDVTNIHAPPSAFF